MGIRWLKNHIENPYLAFSRFTRSSILFAMGLMIILFADRLLPPSIQQELLALLGVLLLTTGGILALLSFLTMTFGRILVYLLPSEIVAPDNPDKQDQGEKHSDS